MKIIFLGQNPSKANINPKVPFLGTKSYTTLKKWIFELGLKEEDCEFYNASDKIGKVTLKDIDFETLKFLIERNELFNFKIVCIGLYAEKALKKVLGKRYLDFYTLPHVSGLNRILNNKIFIDAELIRCKSFIEANF